MVKRIELIGAPSVGKTTNLAEVLKLRKKEDLWITAEEAKIKIATYPGQTKGRLGRIFQFFLKTGQFPKWHRRMASYILEKQYDPVFYRLEKQYDGIATLFVNDLFQDSWLNSIQKLRLFHQYYNLLMKSVMILDNFQLNDLVIYDEGIFSHNLSFCSDEKTKEFFVKNLNNTSIVPVGFIYCYMKEPEKYFHRRRQRIKNGKRRTKDALLNDIQLRELCRKSFNNAEQQMEVLRNHNIPILKINTDKPAEQNADSVYQFIRSFQQ